MIFMDFRAWMPEDGKALAVAPRESFTRFQLAAIIDFHRFVGFGGWADWLAGLAGEEKDEIDVCWSDGLNG